MGTLGMTKMLVKLGHHSSSTQPNMLRLFQSEPIVVDYLYSFSNEDTSDRTVGLVENKEYHLYIVYL